MRWDGYELISVMSDDLPIILTRAQSKDIIVIMDRFCDMAERKYFLCLICTEVLHQHDGYLK